MTKKKLTRVPGNATSEMASPHREGHGRILAGAFALGLMVSPDNLALLGRFAGRFGIYAPLLLVSGAVVYISYVRSYENLYALFSADDGKTPDIRKTLPSLKTAIAVFGVLMILWAIVTTQHVNGTRLLPPAYLT